MAALPKVYTLAETAEILKVSPRTIFNMLAAKKITGFRVGKDWRFTEQEISRVMGLTTATEAIRKKPGRKPGKAGGKAGSK